MRNCKTGSFLIRRNKQKAQHQSEIKIRERTSPTSYSCAFVAIQECHHPKHGKTFCQNIQNHKKVIPPHNKKLSKILYIFKCTKKDTNSDLISLNESKSTSFSTPVFIQFRQWENIISLVVFWPSFLCSKRWQKILRNHCDFSACPLVTGLQLHEGSRDLIFLRSIITA